MQNKSNPNRNTGWGVGGRNTKPESKLMTWTKELRHSSFWLNNTFIMRVLKKPGQSLHYKKSVQQWNSTHTSWNWHRQQTTWDPTSSHCSRIKSTQSTKTFAWTSQDFHNNYVYLEKKECKSHQSLHYIKPVWQWNSTHAYMYWNWQTQDPTLSHCGRIKSTWSINTQSIHPPPFLLHSPF